MIDVHCHLNFHAYEKDYKEIIAQAHKDGVKSIINVGTTIDSSNHAVELARTYEHLYAIVGVHPHHSDKVESTWLSLLTTLAQEKKVLAIGEVGLDYFAYKSNGIVDPATQKHIFEEQIMLAYKLKLPLQIHNRHAGKDILEILTHHKKYLQTVPGMFHCFSGDKAFLKKVLDLGFYVGFDGNITYKGLAPGEDTSLHDLVTYAPVERIVTETDSPFLTPEPHRGKRNIPSYVIIIAEFIAKLKQISIEDFDHIIERNVQTLFGI